ncbi:MAG: DUF5009 domain-containing protein [Chitinophagaceae bacterium]|nr:DUF5009 domain-containing protein [Chitinophagaceae bacterium]
MKSNRLGSIDVLRAFTMYLMVFVNDLPSVKGVPYWLEHAPAQADAMGFSDIIFPGFLFIVGLSIPFAIESRINRGQSQHEVFGHILLRSLALIVMGFFHVNLGNYSHSSILPLAVWEILITLAFFMVWLDYKGEKMKKWKNIIQVSGIVLLILMAVLYKGHSEHGIVWMTPQWWGILGLIGWAYLLCATIVLYVGEKITLAAGFLIFFIFFNSASMLGWVSSISAFTKWGILDFGNASNSTLVMAGVMVSIIYRKNVQDVGKVTGIFCGIAVLFFVFGFLTRHLWGISKIRATPSWTCITAGISLLSFVVLIYLVDRKNKGHWFSILKPAGTSTLTCYLLPYFHLAIFIYLLKLRLPLFFRTGGVGIIKSLAFALIIVLITGWLEKRKLRLKI